MADNIGREIADSQRPLEPPQAAYVIYKALFERGSERLSGENRFIAIGTITGGLIEWKKHLLAAQATEADKWQKKFEDCKAELDDVKLKLAILQKEQ